MRKVTQADGAVVLVSIAFLSNIWLKINEFDIYFCVLCDQLQIGFFLGRNSRSVLLLLFVGARWAFGVARSTISPLPRSLLYSIILKLISIVDSRGRCLRTA